MTECIVNMYFTVIPNMPPLLEEQDGASNFDYIFQNILNQSNGFKQHKSENARDQSD